MRSVYIIIFICIFSLFSNCASNKNYTGGKMITGPAANDIVNYVNQGILAIAELEQKSLESYASVTGENYTSDEKVFETLKDFIIPTYKRYVDGLKKINPENPEIRQLHSIYVRAAESILEGFRAKMVGIENSDEGIIIHGNKQIEEGRKGYEKWRAQLADLYKKHGVAQLKEN